MTGPGRAPTSGFNTGGINAAHQYSFWASDAYYARYLVNGDADFLRGMQSSLVRQYDEWSNNFDSSRGLYWQYPVWDASEYTISSYQTTDPYHGGKGFRPTLNAYQWADAQAISKIAPPAGSPSADRLRLGTPQSAFELVTDWLAEGGLGFLQPLVAGPVGHDGVAGGRRHGRSRRLPWRDVPRTSRESHRRSRRLIETTSVDARRTGTRRRRGSRWCCRFIVPCSRLSPASPEQISGAISTEKP
jgi:hypothetical protein